MLSRKDFCALAGLPSVEALKSRARRGQLPVSVENEGRKSYGYSWFDVFITQVSDQLTKGALKVDPVAAASIARDAATALAAKWPAIAASAAKVRAGIEDREIEWQVIFTTSGTVASVGTPSEIAAARNPKVAAIDMVGGNASRAAAMLLIAAEKHGITIPDEFWTETPTFLPGEFKSSASMWDDAIARVNAASASAEKPITQGRPSVKKAKAKARKGKGK